MSKLFNAAVVTGAASGVGHSLYKELLFLNDNVKGLTRNLLDLSNIPKVEEFDLPNCDLLINCAGTDIGGKIDFVHHRDNNITEILNTNLVAPVLLSHKALKNNPLCKIVNITSTNNNRYWPNNLAYSLSKKGLESFGSMLQVEYPEVNFLEVRLGLTITNFNANRYKQDPGRFADIYSSNKHLTPDEVAKCIMAVLFDPSIKFIEISP